MPYGYSLDFNITDKCNIRCKHCYMRKRDLSLEFDDVKKMLSKLPITISKIVLSGGEPFLNYEVLYRTIEYIRTRFRNDVIIRICSNGKLFYDSEQQIEYELKKLCDYGVNQVLLSNDQYHIEAGIDREKIKKIEEVATYLKLNIKIKYLDIGKGVPVGEFKERNEELISKGGCLNRKENIIQPYLFSATNGDVFLCAFRSTKSLGNLLCDEWEDIGKNIAKQYEFLGGNILMYKFKDVKQKDIWDRMVDEYNKFGECYICQKY